MAYDGNNNAHYIINLEPLDAEDENTKALKNFIHYLTQQNKYLNKENHKLTKTLNSIWRAVQDFEPATDKLKVLCYTIKLTALLFLNTSIYQNF